MSGDHWSRIFKERREARWEEIDHLLDTGLDAGLVAARIGVSTSAIARQAYRYGRDDLGRVFQKPTNRTRRAPTPDWLPPKAEWAGLQEAADFYGWENDGRPA